MQNDHTSCLEQHDRRWGRESSEVAWHVTQMTLRVASDRGFVAVRLINVFDGHDLKYRDDAPLLRVSDDLHDLAIDHARLAYAMSDFDLSFIPALHTPSALLPISRHKKSLLFTIETHQVTVIVGPNRQW